MFVPKGSSPTLTSGPGFQGVNQAGGLILHMARLRAYCLHTQFCDTHVRHSEFRTLDYQKPPPVFRFKWYIWTYASSTVCLCPTFTLEYPKVVWILKYSHTWHSLPSVGSVPLVRQPWGQLDLFLCVNSPWRKPFLDSIKSTISCSSLLMLFTVALGDQTQGLG